MILAEYLAFYPQFTNYPPTIVKNEYVHLANLRFGDFDEDADEARRLYFAHRCTMYAFTDPTASGSQSAASSTAADIVAAGKASAAQQVASKKVDDVQLTYFSGYSGSGGCSSTGFEDLKETLFGLQLLSLIRLNTRSRYIP